MTIEIWLGLVLILSVALNAILIWFSKAQSQRLSYIYENLYDLINILSAYNKHLKQIYSMEMFYGDETLKFLLEHTKSLSSILEEDYGDIAYLTNPMEIEEENYDEEEKEEDHRQEKDVFYAGTRKSDS